MPPDAHSRHATHTFWTRVLSGLVTLTVVTICGGLGAASVGLTQGLPFGELPVDGPPPAASRGPSPQGIPLTEEGPAEPSPQSGSVEDERPSAPPLAPLASPRFWDPRLRRPLPDLAELQRLRFLASPDFPPFTEVDEGGRPKGYHLELVRAICGALEVTDRCQVQVMPWAQLRGALARGDGDAIVAGLAITAESREQLAFTEPYMRFPARFVTRQGASFDPDEAGRVAVVRRTAHEAMLNALFPQHEPVPLSTDQTQRKALEDGLVDAAFGDGATLAGWLASEGAECCEFTGGPYFSDHYLGRGLSIAVRAGEAELVEALDWALAELAKNGRLEEIYLRTFPVGFY